MTLKEAISVLKKHQLYHPRPTGEELFDAIDKGIYALQVQLWRNKEGE